MNTSIFDKLDFGPFRPLLDDDDITDISYDNGGQIWIRSLTQGSMRVEVEGVTQEFVEKLAFQCSNVMGTTFNNAKPFLDAESSELRMNFVHQSIATNGIALVIRKTPAKIRLEKNKLLEEDYFTESIHDFLIKCVQGHCNIMVAGETGSGKTEFVKYLASHTIQNEKIITIEDTLELHLDKIFPQRDIVAMKTNNVASYTDVLVTCMRQNPKWILLSEVRSAEAVSAVRNSISSGHNILSTIHADKASAIPYRLYSLMETDLDVNQFLNTIYRYIQIGIHIKAYYSKAYGKFHREVDEVTEFYVDDNNVPVSHTIYRKQMGQKEMIRPSRHLMEYLENQNIDVGDKIRNLPTEMSFKENDIKDEEANINQNHNSVVETNPNTTNTNNITTNIPTLGTNDNINTNLYTMQQTTNTNPPPIVNILKEAASNLQINPQNQQSLQNAQQRLEQQVQAVQTVQNLTPKQAPLVANQVQQATKATSPVSPSPNQTQNQVPLQTQSPPPIQPKRQPVTIQQIDNRIRPVIPNQNNKTGN